MGWTTLGELASQDLANQSRISLSAKNTPQAQSNKWTANNLRAKVKTPWVAQYDDKHSVFHAIRFDKSFLCDSQKMYEIAAQLIKNDEIVPVNCYVFHSIGKIYATEKGMELVHYPGSTEIKLKMFSVINANKPPSKLCGMSFVHDMHGNSAVVSDEYYDDVTGIDQFNNAFFNLYQWKSRAVPWDRSLDVLWKFFLIHRYFESEYVFTGHRRNGTPGQFCSDFTDWILFANATLFNAGKPHLDQAGIAEECRSFCEQFDQDKTTFIGPTYVADLKKCESALSDLRSVVDSQINKANTSSSSSSGKKKNKQRAPAASSRPWTPGSPGRFMQIHRICSNWNTPKDDGSGHKCTNPYDSFTNQCTMPGTKKKFLHACNVRLTGKGPCAQRHHGYQHTSASTDS